MPTENWLSSTLCENSHSCTRYHPDKATGSEEMFQQVERAYETLTNELARYNWETYGNPDGPTTVTVCRPPL